MHARSLHGARTHTRKYTRAMCVFACVRAYTNRYLVYTNLYLVYPTRYLFLGGVCKGDQLSEGRRA